MSDMSSLSLYPKPGDYVEVHYIKHDGKFTYEFWIARLVAACDAAKRTMCVKEEGNAHRILRPEEWRA